MTRNPHSSAETNFSMDPNSSSTLFKRTFREGHRHPSTRGTKATEMHRCDCRKNCMGHQDAQKPGLEPLRGTAKLRAVPQPRVVGAWPPNSRMQAHSSPRTPRLTHLQLQPVKSPPRPRLHTLAAIGLHDCPVSSSSSVSGLTVLRHSGPALCEASELRSQDVTRCRRALRRL